MMDSVQGILIPTIAILHIPAVAQFLLVTVGAFVVLCFAISLFRGMRLADPIEKTDPSASDRPILDALNRVLRNRGVSDWTLLMLEPEKPDEVVGLADAVRKMVRTTDRVAPAGRQMILLAEQVAVSSSGSLLRRVIQGGSSFSVSRAATVGPQAREKAPSILERARRNLAPISEAVQEGGGVPEMRDQDAARDARTGLITKDALAAHVRRLWRVALERRLPVSVIRMDIDNMIPVLARHGQEGGDAVLCRVGSFLRAIARRDDVVATMGGDDFVVLLMADPTGAQILAQRILEGVRMLAVNHQGAKLVVTMSLGVAGYPLHGRSPADLLEAAERAMKAAVADGRDRCVMASESPGGGQACSASGF